MDYQCHLDCKTPQLDPPHEHSGNLVLQSFSFFTGGVKEVVATEHSHRTHQIFFLSALLGFVQIVLILR